MIATNTSNATKGSLDTLFQCVRFTGKDHKDFLQAQLSCDVKSLGTLPAARLGAWLNPKGRVLALAWWLVDEDHTLAVTTSAGASQLTGALTRYVLRSKTTITQAPELHVSGILSGARSSSPEDVLPVERIDDGWSMDLFDGRRLVVTETASAEADIANTWTAADITAGIPQIHDAGIGEWIAQAIGLERLNAVSVRKGCYPGQEIVARMHFLGRGKRRLARGMLADTDVAPETAAQVCDADGKNLGEVVQSASEDSAAAILVTLHEGAFDKDVYVNTRKIDNLVPF